MNTNDPIQNPVDALILATLIRIRAAEVEAVTPARAAFLRAAAGAIEARVFAGQATGDLGGLRSAVGE
ncbi:hypothetical protein ACW7BJ_16265 [Azospirillum argentinense]